MSVYQKGLKIPDYSQHFAKALINACLSIVHSLNDGHTLHTKKYNCFSLVLLCLQIPL